MKSKQKFEAPPFRNYPTILKEGRELRGPLDLVEPYDDGLIHIRVAGLDRLVSDELEGKLRPLIGHWVGILRIGRWCAMEVPA